MHLKITPRYIVAFLLLLIVMMELHEIVHITLGRILCGCWGPRDFNVWSLCEGCKENQPLWWTATLIGPAFSFLMMWMGMAWLSSPNLKKSALGFSLIFANIPFGRITTVMMGGGDEMVVIKNFFKEDFTRPQMILIGSILILAVGLPPIVKAFKVIKNRLAWLYILAFMTVPLMFLLVYTLVALNTLLSNGFLSNEWIMGTPILITLHTLMAMILLTLFRKNLYLLNQE
jgi:hypothetical protein